MTPERLKEIEEYFLVNTFTWDRNKLDELIKEVKLLQAILGEAHDESAMYRQGYLDGQKAMHERLTALLTETTPPKKMVRDGREVWVTTTSRSPALEQKFSEVEPAPYERKET